MPTRLARVGFLLESADASGSSALWLSLLLTALSRQPISITTVLVTDQDPSPDWRSIVGEVAVVPGLAEAAPLSPVHRLAVRAGLLPSTGRVSQPRRVAALNLDALFGFFLADSRLRTRILSWLPDFQHRECPMFFSAEERARRDRRFLGVAERADRVILMSDSVRAAFAVFAPQYARKSRTIRVAATLPPSTEHAPLVRERYRLPERFLLFPAQLWQHKGHDTLLAALADLRRDGLFPFIVLTGPLHDSRNPRYADALFRTLSETGLRDQVAVLGVIPRDHLVALLRQSAGVMNPSRYEGFALSVDEAAAAGKRVIASDIPAHREHRDAEIMFFPPGDASALAGSLRKAWLEWPHGVDPAREEQALSAALARARDGAMTFAAVVQELMAVR
jgi:glycosyltransferase involved in cell wall biosynthesis